MHGPRWLPSEEAWLERIANLLFDGQVVVVRTVPRWGISQACSYLSTLLGKSALTVDGATTSEIGQADFRHDLDGRIDAILSQDGMAQIVFDNYGDALRRSQGGALHSLLYRLLIDSQSARDTGALLVAEYGQDLNLGFAGSPLLSRAEMISLPRLSVADCDYLGMDFDEVRRLAGSGTWLARRRAGRPVEEWRLQVVEHLVADQQRLSQALPLPALEVLLGERPFRDSPPLAQEALSQLGLLNKAQDFELGELVGASGFAEAVHLENPGWPRERGDSVAKFASLLAGVESAIWVDRYLVHEPAHIRGFLLSLRRETDTRLRLLASPDMTQPEWEMKLALALHDVPNIELRTMAGADRHRLHDRQLVNPSANRGFTLPTARVICGRDEPGSAVSLNIPSLAFNYSDSWNRAKRVSLNFP